MTLRRKLLVAFGGLAALALLAAAVTVYLTARWQGTTVEMRDHYTRSLLLQSVRAETFQALAEVNDALAGEPDDYADARADFERAISDTDANLAEWRALAGDLSETTEVLEVRAAYERLTTYAREVFDLLDQGRRDEAIRLVDDELDTGDYAQFQDVTELAVAADARVRETVTAASEDLRITALVMSAVIAIAALSLTLLIAAYLAQDLFQPLARLRSGLDRLAGGEENERMPTGRQDEFGDVALAFNRAAEAFDRKGGRSSEARSGDETVPSTPGEIVLAAAARIRSALASLRRDTEDGDAQTLHQLETDAETLVRSLAIGFPANVRLVLLDPRIVAQDALTALGATLAERGVSCECEFEPERAMILADHRRLREIVADLLKEALAALPDNGGRVGLRVQRDPPGARVFIDVATSGGRSGAEANDPKDGLRGYGVVRRHFVSEQRGSLEIKRRPNGASVMRLAFPLAMQTGVEERAAHRSTSAAEPLGSNSWPRERD